MTVPATTGVTVIDREGTEQGSPDQAFPEVQVDRDPRLDRGQFGASLTGRYIAGVEEANGNEMDSRLYTDVQLRWNPDWLGDGLGFAIGANNLFDADPPPCFTCGLNNMDPTTYDVPGTFFYGRVTFQDVGEAVPEIVRALFQESARPADTISIPPATVREAEPDRRHGTMVPWRSPRGGL